MKKITKKQIIDANPCTDGLDFAKSCGYNMRKIYDTCERGDWMVWMLRRANAIDQMQAVGIACLCARRALVHFEKKYPNDKRPRLAIEAAETWAKNPTAENKKACADAANAANAADAAAYAAYAAAYAAYAAYAAAYAAERNWQANEIRKLIPNPFK